MSTTDPDPSGLTVEEASPEEATVTADLPPGPAGLAVVTFLDGAAALAVDVAEPDAVVRLVLPTRHDERTGRLVTAVLARSAADALDRWLTRPSPRHVASLDPERSTRRTDPGGARRSFRRLGLFGRLAVGLDEVVRPELTDAVLATSLVDLGALAFDLGDLGPSPDGVALVTAGLDRWEELDPDDWDDEEDALLAATNRRSPQWRKSVYAHRPDLADRLEVLTRELRRRQDRSNVIARSVLFDAPFPATARRAPAPEPAAAVAAAATRPRPVVNVEFDADLDGRLIAAERADHHLVVHLGGLGPDDLWFRVFEAGTVPRLLALVPVGPPERTWRTAVALIGPDVSDDDLLADVTRHPKEPWRSPTVRRTERATHLGRVAARLSRVSVQGSYRADARDAWLRCAEAWEEAGDRGRAERAAAHAGLLPTPEWTATDPLLSDLP